MCSTPTATCTVRAACRTTSTGNRTGRRACYWYETDGRGDVVAVTDVNGNVVDSYEYDLWGEPLSYTTHEQV